MTLGDSALISDTEASVEPFRVRGDDEQRATSLSEDQLVSKIEAKIRDWGGRF